MTQLEEAMARLHDIAYAHRKLLDETTRLATLTLALQARVEALELADRATCAALDILTSPTRG